MDTVALEAGWAGVCRWRLWMGGGMARVSWEAEGKWRGPWTRFWAAEAHGKERGFVYWCSSCLCDHWDSRLE